jgi:hypothetical protein
MTVWSDDGKRRRKLFDGRLAGEMLGREEAINHTIHGNRN